MVVMQEFLGQTKQSNFDDQDWHRSKTRKRKERKGRFSAGSFEATTIIILVVRIIFIITGSVVRSLKRLHLNLIRNTGLPTCLPLLYPCRLNLNYKYY